MSKTWKFPAGEVGVRVDIGESVTEPHMLNLKFKGSDDIIELLLEVDALRRYYGASTEIWLNALYFPYARQDRVMQEGESHSLKVIADLINSCNFTKVFVADPHSDVVEALVNNCKIYHQVDAIEDTVHDLAKYDFFIAPDAGALKKIYKIAQRHKKPVICASKVRDVATGEILGMQVQQEDYLKLLNNTALVIDDICDGGKTFLELRKTLPTIADVDLYVTHGIFSKGKEELSRNFNEIFCYNDMSQI